MVRLLCLMKIKLFSLFIPLFYLLSCSGRHQPKNEINMTLNQTEDAKKLSQDSSETDTITFGAGCFWCVEAVFQRVNGVISVKSGYCGGHVKNPAYREVCEGTTGHAEVCLIVFNPKQVSVETLLSVFWQTHDPTTLNRQGNDVGTQYRSAIFYHDENQKMLAHKFRDDLNKSAAFDKPIVTEISPFSIFYPAEDYHQNYYNQNTEQPYCSYIIAPKLDKFKKVFKQYLKEAH